MYINCEHKINCDCCFSFFSIYYLLFLFKIKILFNIFFQRKACDRNLFTLTIMYVYKQINIYLKSHGYI